MFTNQELNLIRNACINYLGDEKDGENEELTKKIISRCEDFLSDFEYQVFNHVTRNFKK